MRTKSVEKFRHGEDSKSRAFYNWIPPLIRSNFPSGGQLTWCFESTLRLLKREVLYWSIVKFELKPFKPYRGAVLDHICGSQLVKCSWRFKRL